jgi:hypothetical protein
MVQQPVAVLRKDRVIPLALRAKLTGTAADDNIKSILDLLENEVKALNAVLDGEQDPLINMLSPANATALQHAIASVEQ